MTKQSHAIDVDLELILPILARAIYTSPFAFLRENVQNAFDAIRMQQYRELIESQNHEISITLNEDRLSITDTGIGMTKEDLVSYYWSIGKSGKHTSEAKAAGVVGTFGIGGMANFGICTRLEVTSRTRDVNDVVVSYAERQNLSASRDCVFYDNGPADHHFGTTVTGRLMQSINLNEVLNYLQPIVRFLDLPVLVNGTRIQQEEFPTVKKEDGCERVSTSGSATVTMFVRALQNGQAQIEVEKLQWDGKEVDLRAVFETNSETVAAYQHGFMLANVPVTSVFGIGGVVDSAMLRPTAGREAVTDASRELVQSLLAGVERGLADHISVTEGLADRFSSFYRYMTRTGFCDLAGPATVRVHGGARRPLSSLRGFPIDKIYYARDGHDQAIMQAYAERQKIVALLSRDGHRQRVERTYLENYCNAQPLEDSVTCVRIVEKLSFSQSVLQFQLQSRLRTQFLIDGLQVKAGELTHGAMLWIPRKKGGEKILFVDFRHAQIKRLIELTDSLSFDSVFDIFIRDFVLPHLENSFPELRKRDFDALLRKLQSTVEHFEIDPRDISRIRQLAAFTNMAPEHVAAVFGARRSGIPRPTSIGRNDVVSVTQQVNEAVQQASGMSVQSIRNELELRFLETEVNAKLLDATEIQAEIGLARYYLALTSDAHVLYRRIFLERKPATDFSWGGHRAGYLFYSHGQSVVYYDIQFEELLGEIGHDRVGTRTLDHSPLVLKSMVFLPIPKSFEQHVIPKNKTLRFTIQHQIMGVSSVVDYNN
ncbi:MAG: hypothetical protein F4X44_05510 [Gammaproteobacteria bacterium]|nr:hypothetical protein [Gammaproteobacteria bacterium]